MNEEVRIKNEETGAGRLVLAMCGGWSAARNTAMVRGMASARQGRLVGLKMPKMRLCKMLRIKARRASLGFVGPLNFKKIMKTGVRRSLRTATMEKHQASKLQQPEKLQAPRDARAWAEGKKHKITKRTHFKNAGIA